MYSERQASIKFISTAIFHLIVVSISQVNRPFVSSILVHSIFVQDARVSVWLSRNFLSRITLTLSMIIECTAAAAMDSPECLCALCLGDKIQRT